MSGLLRGTRWLALLLLAAAGCAPDAADSTPSSEPAPSPAAAEAAAKEATAQARVDAEALIVDEAVRHGAHARFTPCADDPELECGTLSVPVDYARPRGARIELATVRAAATGPRRQGVIFVNPGGPGGSGVDFVILAKALFLPLRTSFDIVSFDPRGTNRSAPVDCAVELPPPPVDSSLEVLSAYYDEVGRRYAAACAAQHGALASAVGTNNVARDIDVFRAALGERELGYLGYSYGTALGASYATLFPDRVRAMVLDGNIPPPWFSDYLLELDSEGSAGAEAALRRLDKLCRNDATCALRTAGVVATFDRVVARLDANPVPAPGGVISGMSVVRVVFGALYNEAFGWPYAVNLLAQVDQGDLSQLPAFPPEVGGEVLVSGGFAVVCNDSATRRPGLDYLPVQDAFNASYPRFGGANFGVGPVFCSGWPRPPVVALDNLRTRGSIVLIGNDFDPATPMSWSRNMSTALGAKARLVRYQGGGHTIYGSGSACIDGAVERYFREGTVPSRGLTCPAVTPVLGAGLRAASQPTMSEVVQQVAPQSPRLPRTR